MQNAAHTPGPWHTSSTHRGAAVDIGAANGANVALVSGPAENGADEFKANARLIAAAPDLLAALEYARNHIMNPDNTDVSDLYRTIGAALRAAGAGREATR